MPGRPTNLALLALLVLALLSGFAAFGVGTRAGRLVVIAHGALGLAIVLLAPWKSVVVKRGITRSRPGRGLSIALSLFAIVTVASGVAQVIGSVPRVGTITMMQIHVGGGVVALILGGVHAAQRRTRPRVTDLSRRNLVRSGGVLAASALAYMASESIWRVTDAPGAHRRFTGSHEVSSGMPSGLPATQWLNDAVQLLEPGHKVTIVGREHTADEIARHGDELEAVLDCTGGWYSRQRWRGARLDRLVDTPARSLIVRSVTGYWRRFPSEQANRLLLATHVGDTPLTSRHGAPVRLVAPGRRGFWWVKWVETVDVDDLPPWWQPPLPLA